MKHILIALAFLVSVFSVSAQPLSDRLKAEFAEAEYGLHLISMHVPNSTTNNGNLGAYLITKHNIVLSHYHNSVWTYTNVVGWKTPEFYRMSATLGYISGYKILNGKDWIFGVIPEVRLATFDRPVEGVKELNVRLEVIPNLDKTDILQHGSNAVGLWHLAAGIKFN